MLLKASIWCRYVAKWPCAGSVNVVARPVGDPFIFTSVSVIVVGLQPNHDNADTCEYERVSHRPCDDVHTSSAGPFSDVSAPDGRFQKHAESLSGTCSRPCHGPGYRYLWHAWPYQRDR